MVLIRTKDANMRLYGNILGSPVAETQICVCTGNVLAKLKGMNVNKKIHHSQFIIKIIPHHTPR